MSSRAAVVVLVGVLAVGAAMAQVLVAAPTYTVQFDDTLENVIKRLEQEQGIRIEADQDLRSARVVVDLSEVAELELVEKICRQVGAIDTDAPGSRECGGFWNLQAGDWDSDSRPQTCVRDINLALTRVAHVAAREFEHCGADDQPAPIDRTELHLTAWSRNPFHHETLHAVRITQALLDDGSTLKNPPYRARGTHYPVNHVYWVLPPPPEGARSIVELQGEMQFVEIVAGGSVEFTPDEVGTIKLFGATPFTLGEWRDEGGSLRIELTHIADMKCYSRLHALLYCEEGPPLVALGGSGRNVSGAAREHFRFTRPPSTPVRVVVLGHLFTVPGEIVPFVIKDIPLP